MDTSPFALLLNFPAYLKWYHEEVERRPEYYDTVHTKAQHREHVREWRRVAERNAPKSFPCLAFTYVDRYDEHDQVFVYPADAERLLAEVRNG